MTNRTAQQMKTYTCGIDGREVTLFAASQDVADRADQIWREADEEDCTVSPDTMLAVMPHEPTLATWMPLSAALFAVGCELSA